MYCTLFTPLYCQSINYSQTLRAHPSGGDASSTMSTREAIPGSGPTPPDDGQQTPRTRGYVLLLCGVAAVCVEGVGLHRGAYPIGAGVWAGLVACVSGVWSLRTREGGTAMALGVLNTITATGLVVFSSFILARSRQQLEGVWLGGVVRNLYLLCYSVLLLLGLVILGVAVQEVKEKWGRGVKTFGHQQGWQYSNLGAEVRVV